MREIITGSFENARDSKRPMQLRAVLLEDLGMIGTEGSIGFYNLYSGDGSKLLSKEQVCIKEIREKVIRHCPEAGVVEVQKKYQALKKEGLPVSPFLFINRENNLLIMQDYTKGGFFGSVDKHNTVVTFGHNIVNIETIRRDSIDVGTRALLRSGVFLYQDAYATVINRKTHNAKILLSDFGRQSYFNDYGYTRTDVEEQVDYFVGWLVA